MIGYIEHVALMGKCSLIDANGICHNMAEECLDYMDDDKFIIDYNRDATDAYYCDGIGSYDDLVFEKFRFLGH